MLVFIALLCLVSFVLSILGLGWFWICAGVIVFAIFLLFLVKAQDGSYHGKNRDTAFDSSYFDGGWGDSDSD